MKAIRDVVGGVKFSDGTVIYDNHEPDCCEHVYADWNALDDTTFFDEEFDSIKIEKVDGVGFRINTYFVPCYNIQEGGWYSSNLELIITKPDNSEEIIDISDCSFFEER